MRHVVDSKGQAVVVALEPAESDFKQEGAKTIESLEKILHITLSCTKNTNPSYSNVLISENVLQLKQ